MAIGPTPSFQKVYRIHPGIGVARIGNSRAPGEDGFFIGPETPDIDFVPPGGKYRDAKTTSAGRARGFASTNTPTSCRGLPRLCCLIRTSHGLSVRSPLTMARSNGTSISLTANRTTVWAIRFTMTQASRRSAASTNRPMRLARFGERVQLRHIENRRQGTSHCARWVRQIRVAR